MPYKCTKCGVRIPRISPTTTLCHLCYRKLQNFVYTVCYDNYYKQNTELLVSTSIRLPYQSFDVSLVFWNDRSELHYRYDVIKPPLMIVLFDYDFYLLTIKGKVPMNKIKWLFIAGIDTPFLDITDLREE